MASRRIHGVEIHSTKTGLAEIAKILRPGGSDLTTIWAKADKHSKECYLAAIHPPESYVFTLEGIARDITAGREMLHRDLGMHDPIGPSLDLRIGYDHWMRLSVATGKKLEEFLYRGTPPEGLRSGDRVTVRGWEGLLVQRPLLLNDREELQRYGYILNPARPRTIHRITIHTRKGTMTYGSEEPEVPTPPPMGFDELDSRIPVYDATEPRRKRR